MKNSDRFNPHLFRNAKPATTIKGIENNDVFTAENRETGSMEYFRKGKRIDVDEGFSLSLGKAKPFDKSGIGVFSGFGEGTLNKFIKDKIKET